MNEKRWVSIASSVKSAIQSGELKAGARIASDIEMASQWRVSPVTVQRAMSELHREGWVIRRRKFGTVVADLSERSLTKIALVFPHMSEKPQSTYLRGIEDSLADKYHLVPLDSRSNPKDEAKCLEQAARDCQAVICYPGGSPENTALLNKIAARLPLVLVDRCADGVEADTVTTDNYGSMLLGLKHLYMRGHRRIGYILGDHDNVSSVRDRCQAYRQFMEFEIGLSDPERWERKYPTVYTGWEPYAKWSEEVLAEMLNGPEPPTAIVCPQDADIFAVIDACVHLNIRISQDLSLLSFYDTGVNLPMSRYIDRLVQRPIEMGHLAAHRIEQGLRSSTRLPPQKMTLMCDLFAAETHVPGPHATAFLNRRQRH